MTELSLGKVIRNLRKQNKLTQKELSKKTGFSQNTISNHENGMRSIGENEINIYSNALGVSRESLFKELDQLKNTEETMLFTQIGEAVKKQRQELNIDFNKIYKKTKLTQKKIESIENGYVGEIGLGSIFRLIELLNISPTMLDTKLDYFESYNEYLEKKKMRADLDNKISKLFLANNFENKKKLYKELNAILEKYSNKEE